MCPTAAQLRRPCLSPAPASLRSSSLRSLQKTATLNHRLKIDPIVGRCFIILRRPRFRFYESVQSNVGCVTRWSGRRESSDVWPAGHVDQQNAQSGRVYFWML